MSIKWHVEKVVVIDDDARVHWRVVGEDGNSITDPGGRKFPNTASSCGEWGIDSSLITPTTTEDDVIAALKSSLGDVEVTKIEGSLETQLARNITPAGKVYRLNTGAA